MSRPPPPRLALLAALVIVVLGACNGGSGDRKAGEPCTRDRDCEAPLECVGGVCSEQTEGADASAEDLDGGRR